MIEFPILGQISAALLLVILGALSLLHFYWMVGGKWRFENAVPRKENGALLFVPSKFSCFVVGVGLSILTYLIYSISFALLIHESDYNFVISLIAQNKPFAWCMRNFLLIAGILFLLRAIGDFNYVGFFKKIKDTEFARLDTRYYSPLCFFVGGLFFLFLFYSPYLQK